MKSTFAPFGDDVVRLRLLSEKDLETTMACRNQDDVRVWFKSTQVITLDQHKAWFAHYLKKDDDFVFVVEADGKTVGQAAVYGIDREAGTAEVGRFMVTQEARGRGYLGRACAELLRFCAGQLRLKSVFLEVKEDNARAISMYLRNGFTEEERAGGMIRMIRPLTAPQDAEEYVR